MSGEYSAAEISARNLANLSYSAQVARTANTTAQRPIAAYNHFFVGGQSLSNGSEAWPALTIVPPYAGNVMVGQSVHRGGSPWVGFGDNDFHPLVATVKADDFTLLTPAEQAALAPGEQNSGETPLEAALTFLRKAVNDNLEVDDDLTRKFIGSDVGAGGRTIGELSTPSFEYGRIAACAGVAKATATGLGGSYSIPAFLFLQGEKDYGQGTTKAAYKATLKQYVADIRADTLVAVAGQTKPLAFITYQTGASWTRDALDLAVGMAQFELMLEEPDWYMACPVYPVTDKDGHLDANGSRWVGEQFGKVLAKLFVHNQGWQPLHPRSLTVRGREVLVDFHVPEPPLVWDLPYVVTTATDYTTKGFAARDADGANAIVSAEIVADTMVLFTLARDKVGALRLRYADKAIHNGNGCLRDSDATRSFFNYEYNAGSGQYESANIDELVDQPYRLANWCVAFDLPVIDEPSGEDIMSEAVARLAGRVDGDYANGGHREVFVPDLNAVATVSVAVATDAESAVSAAEQAAASLALALELTGGAVAIGGDPMGLPRNTELGSAAFISAWALIGMPVETHDATYQIVPGDLSKVMRATSGTRTWTLPAAADVPLGWWCVAKNRSGNNLTINRSGSDTIDAAATSLTIATGASLTIVKSSATTWESY